MEMVPVNSSNIARVGYEGGTLYIEFHTGAVYQYFDVPENIHQDLMNASSQGQYFASYIKGRFRFARV
jgi:hypothetical protein